MSDYNRYSFTVKEDDVLRVLHDAASAGVQPLLYINGMFYNVELKNVRPADPADMF